MAKWADYVITCVTMSWDGSEIASVGVRPDDGDKLGSTVTHTRQTVIDNVESLFQPKSYVTATLNPSTMTWAKGANVEVKQVGRRKFITTHPNDVTRDNLGQLPTCPA